MKLRLLLPILLLALSACAAPSSSPHPAPEARASMSSPSAATIRDVTLVSPAGTRVTVRSEVVTTEAAREHGLMGREDLRPNTGMLFVFPQPMPLSFWMKNTLIPLDVLYFAADGSWIASYAMTPCTADPCTIYSTQQSGLYALEVPAGSAATWGIGEGWTMETAGMPAGE